MGMFDCYEPMPAVVCPNCALPLEGWQGKGGPCELLTWTQGQAVPLLSRFHQLHDPNDPLRHRLDDGECEIYTQCQGKPDACGIWVDAAILVKDGVWQETRVLTAAVSAVSPGD